jgi:hypothetical protein
MALCLLLMATMGLYFIGENLPCVLGQRLAHDLRRRRPPPGFGWIALRPIELDGLVDEVLEGPLPDIAHPGELDMPHLAPGSFQQAARIGQVHPAPETEVHAARMGLDVGEGTIDLVHRLRPLDGFLGLRRGLLHDRSNRRHHLLLPPL